MIKKILNNLKKPHLIPFKILYRLEFFYKKKTYNHNLFEERQNNIFKKLNLDRNLGLTKLDDLKEKNSFLNREMSSEHEILFSSLSIKTDTKIKEILEIGTFDGLNANLLSLLFKDSNVDTIDLKSSEANFKNFYNRNDKVEEFIKFREKNLAKNDKINFQETNSINLINANKKYDLIWIDGAHGYPMVCIDIINSLRLINKNGFIICDDVYTSQINSDKIYNSYGAYETLEELKKENLIWFNLIYKRLDPSSNCLEKKRKFVAIFKKVN